MHMLLVAEPHMPSADHVSNKKRTIMTSSILALYTSRYSLTWQVAKALAATAYHEQCEEKT